MLEMVGWNDFSFLERVDFVLTAISVFGIAAIFGVLQRFLVLRRPGRKIVRFRHSWRQSDPLSIVISTSEKYDPADSKRVGGALEFQKNRGLHKTRLWLARGKREQISEKPDYPRAMVSVWTTYAVTEITEVSSMLGYRKTFETDIAERLTHNQTGDLVLIGGRFKNTRSKQFTEHFNACHPELAITRSKDSPTGCKELKIGREEFNFTPAKDEKTGYTVSDRAILVLWRNPFTTGKKPRRGILCAGFTSMGTAGAAQYLSDSLQDGTLRRKWLEERPSGWRHRRFPQFIVVLHVNINNDRYLDVYPLKLIPIVEKDSAKKRFQRHHYDSYGGDSGKTEQKSKR